MGASAHKLTGPPKKKLHLRAARKSRTSPLPGQCWPPDSPENVAIRSDPPQNLTKDHIPNLGIMCKKYVENIYS